MSAQDLHLSSQIVYWRSVVVACGCNSDGMWYSWLKVELKRTFALFFYFFFKATFRAYILSTAAWQRMFCTGTLLLLIQKMSKSGLCGCCMKLRDLDVIRLWLFSTSHLSLDSCQYSVCFQSNILHTECSFACCLSQTAETHSSLCLCALTQYNLGRLSKPGVNIPEWMGLYVLPWYFSELSFRPGLTFPDSTYFSSKCSAAEHKQ